MECVVNSTHFKVAGKEEGWLHGGKESGGLGPTRGRCARSYRRVGEEVER